jgi:hypothetical protein
VFSEKHNLGWSSQETFVVELATGLLQSLPQNCLAWCVLEGGGQWPWKPEIINWKYNILKFKMHLSINVYFTSIIDESIYWNFSLKRSWQFLQMLAVASIFKQYRVSCAASFWGALFRTYLVSEVHLFLMKVIMYCTVYAVYFVNTWRRLTALIIFFFLVYKSFLQIFAFFGFGGYNNFGICRRTDGFLSTSLSYSTILNFYNWVGICFNVVCVILV